MQVTYNVSLINFTASNVSANTTLVFYWKRNGTAACADYQIFWINNMTGNTGLVGALQSLKTDAGMSNSALGILAVFIISVLVAWIVRSSVGGAAVGLVLVWFLTVTNWIHIYVAFLLTLFGISILYFTYSRGN